MKEQSEISGFEAISKLSQTLRSKNHNPDQFNDLGMLKKGAEKPVIFDVGANIGTVSARFLTMYPDADIHAFEPTPDVFEKLNKNLPESCHLNQLAISEEPGTLPFYISTEQSGINSLLERNQEFSEDYIYVHDKVLEIPVTTLDAYCVEKGISHIDILKTDIQGMDLFALKGARGLLEKQAIDVVYSEVLFLDYYKGSALFYEVWEFMLSVGYSLFNLYDIHSTRDGRINWSDGLFISNTFRDHYLEMIQNSPEAQEAAEQAAQSASGDQLPISLFLDMSENVHTQGFYPPHETPAYGTLRWTGPDRTATLYVPLSIDRRARVSFQVVNAGSNKVLDSLVFKVGDTPITLEQEVLKKNVIVYSGMIEKGMLDGPVVSLTFEVEKTASFGINPLNRRRVGVCLSYLHIFPY